MSLVRQTHANRERVGMRDCHVESYVLRFYNVAYVLPLMHTQSDSQAKSTTEVTPLSE